jgi:hypothetical protein
MNALLCREGIDFAARAIDLHQAHDMRGPKAAHVVARLMPQA